MDLCEQRYILWNYMLAEHCLLSDSCEGVVLLTVTPRILAAALEDAGEGVHSPQEAEADFVAAVAGTYQRRVLQTAIRLRALRSTDANDVPLGVGFLALSVLAAYHMRTDDEHTGRAFYPRFAEMLGCELSRSYPVGFDGDTFVALWDELAKWLQEQHGRHLATPDTIGVRRYVAFPLAHVPLRQVDIERLPLFFELHGYESGARAPLDRLAHDLYGRPGPWRQLTESGQQALEDPGRRAFVLRQVAHELEHWDGCRTDASGRRVATVELWMDIRRRRPQLFLLARRPRGFPPIFENGEFVFESSQEGWYDPVPLGREDGPVLNHGMRVSAEDGRYLLELRHAKAIPLTPSDEYTGYVSDRTLRADTQCAVLCAETISVDVERFLTSLGSERIRPRRDDSLPSGWCLFTDVLASASADPPAGLERLAVERSVTLIPEGGLRLGHRWTWLESAPARLMVAGSHQGLKALIDGLEVGLSGSGQLPNKRLRPAGEHIVEIGNRLRQRVRVLRAEVDPECRRWKWHDQSSGPVPLPSGRWVVLGSGFGECAGVLAQNGGGVLVRPPFLAKWAVKVGAGPGATALHLHDIYGAPEERSEAHGTFALSPISWADTIYQVGIRRPRFSCSSGCDLDELRVAWHVLMIKARSQKREMRRRRR